MDIFLDLLAKLLPIYSIIGLGFWLTRKFSIDKDSVVKLLIYLIAPVVIFNGVYELDLSLKILLLPGIFYIVSSTLAILTFVLTKNNKLSKMRGILAFTAGSGNTGYFGLPVAVAVFGESAVGLAVLCTFGFVMYENTTGFFLAAKANNTAKQAIKKILSLPMLYAFTAAVILNFADIDLGGIYRDFVPNFRGAFVILGSFVVGSALAGITRTDVDLRAMRQAFMTKFIIWPVIIGSLIQLDKTFWQVFTSQPGVYGVAFLMSIVPLAANTVAYATLLKEEPEKTAFMVFVSTVIALAYIPLLVALVLPRLV